LPCARPALLAFLSPVLMPILWMMPIVYRGSVQRGNASRFD
jgi:hypothetical protein